MLYLLIHDMLSEKYSRSPLLYCLTVFYTEYISSIGSAVLRNREGENHMMKAAFCISGSASTARRILDECSNGILVGLVDPVLVIASRQCGGIENCIQGGMRPDNVVILQKRDFDSAEAHAQAMLRELQDRGVDFVGQYGYTSLTHEMIIEAFPDMMVNQHPGPLDPPNEDFGGRHMVGHTVHECVLEFAKSVGGPFHETEATAHRVTPEYDKGVVVGRRLLTLRSDHTPESLAADLLPIEHELQVEVIGQFATGTVIELRRAGPLIRPAWAPILQTVKQRVIARHQ